MQHRHLLPNELDLLVDGDVGFGVAPLRAHVEACADCRERLEALRGIAAQLDALPHFTPSVGFSDRVMAQVQVIEPWHVALRDTARGWLPRSTPMRVLALAGAGVAATTVSASAVWLGFRLHLLGWSAESAVGNGAQGAWAALTSAAGEALNAAGAPGAVFAGLATVAVTAVGAVFAFRRLAAAARSNGE